MNLNWLDFVIILLVGASVAGGVVKGFARVGVGFAAAVGGLLGGIWFYGIPGYYLLPYVSSRSVANFIGFWVVFLLCLLLGALAGKGMAVLFKWTGLTWLDRLLGSLFGLLRGLVAATALVLVLVAFAPKPPPSSVVGSHWAPYLLGAADLVAELAPHDLKDGFLQSYERIRELWEETLENRSRRLKEAEH